MSKYITYVQMVMVDLFTSIANMNLYLHFKRELMHLDWSNHGSKPKKETVYFFYKKKPFLDTFGQGSGNNGYKDRHWISVRDQIYLQTFDYHDVFHTIMNVSNMASKCLYISWLLT